MTIHTDHKTDTLTPSTGTLTIDGELIVDGTPVGGGYMPGGTDVAVADGGTGASDASGARTNLGVYSTGEVDTAISAAVAGLAWKQAVRVATTANGTLATAFENGDTIDGVTLATGDRILIKNQSSGAENGIYVVAASGAPTRATDADSGAELVNASVYVSEGTANADTQWTCTTDATITVGSTALVFAQVNTGGGSFTAASTTEVLTGADNAKGVTPDALAALWEQGSDVASAGTVSLGEGGYFNITGTTTITDIDFATDKAGRHAWVKFAGALTLTHHATTLILPTGASITTAAGDTACFISEGADAVRCVAYQRASGAALSGGGSVTDFTDLGDVPASYTGEALKTVRVNAGETGLEFVTPTAGSGSLIGVQTVTATGAGTYTPTAGTASIIIEMVGGGGGGGGIASPTGTNIAVAAGGAGGAYLRKRLTANFSGASYSVGAKGTGGTAGNNAGNNGGNTTFTDTAGSPTVYTAGGGTGGGGDAGRAAGVAGNGAAAGAATNGDINIPGGNPLRGFMSSSTAGFGSSGGSSHYSPQGAQVQASGANTTAAGSAAPVGGKGGGGGGAAGTGTGVARAGGDGTDGILIIWEYS